MKNLSMKKIAILATDGFEESELMEPLKALREAGADVEVVSLKSGSIRGWEKDHWSKTITVDKTIDKADAEIYDGLMLPGGVLNPDKLRREPKAVAFVRAFFDQHKPVAAICHGPWMLVEADVVRGKRLTSYGSIRTDLKNAGAEWVDKPVVVDQGLVTSRSPADLDVFVDRMIQEFQLGEHHIPQAQWI